MHTIVARRANGKNRMKATSINNDISIGDLIDKNMISDIEQEQTEDSDKLVDIRTEPGCLNTIVGESVNLGDWRGGVGDHRRNKYFDDSCTACAQNGWKANDNRAAVKRGINALVGPPSLEKSPVRTTDVVSG